MNQFSMDEYQGYSRVATTRGEAWCTDEYTAVRVRKNARPCRRGVLMGGNCGNNIFRA
ncbi:beta-propeller domain-containing protein [Neomoorella glycerini]|uniref:beta-propeller domain-containing protein n=1 Tax=Neomoorella glycerini TaxID=55779 RepID=UPI001FE9DBA4|nr:beta-propeller domain-containing protein [Moorella glycerini]